MTGSPVHEPQPIASSGSLELAYPECPKGIGSVIDRKSVV